MRVLVVEDEKRLAAGLEKGLEAEGFAVDVALDGTDGLWMAREHPYDVIVLDIMLPGVNGYRVCSTLREEKNWTPILMLTAKDGEWDEAEALGPPLGTRSAVEPTLGRRVPGLGGGQLCPSRRLEQRVAGLPAPSEPVHHRMPHGPGDVQAQVAPAVDHDVGGSEPVSSEDAQRRRVDEERIGGHVVDPGHAGRWWDSLEVSDQRRIRVELGRERPHADRRGGPPVGGSDGDDGPGDGAGVDELRVVPHDHAAEVVSDEVHAIDVGDGPEHVDVARQVLGEVVERRPPFQVDHGGHSGPLAVPPDPAFQGSPRPGLGHEAGHEDDSSVGVHGVPSANRDSIVRPGRAGAIANIAEAGSRDRQVCPDGPVRGAGKGRRLGAPRGPVRRSARLGESRDRRLFGRRPCRTPSCSRWPRR